MQRLTISSRSVTKCNFLVILSAVHSQCSHNGLPPRLAVPIGHRVNLQRQTKDRLLTIVILPRAISLLPLLYPHTVKYQTGGNIIILNMYDCRKGRNSITRGSALTRLGPISTERNAEDARNSRLIVGTLAAYLAFIPRSIDIIIPLQYLSNVADRNWRP